MAAAKGLAMRQGVVLPYRGKMPVVDPSVTIAHGAVIVGDVEIGSESSVWFNAVIRGDVHYIRIGERTNIQDASVLHVTGEKYPLIIGSSVTIGHGVIVHGASVGDHCLLGMGCRILDNAVIEPYAIVGAGAVVKQDQVVKSGSLVAGVPSRVVRAVTDEERRMIEASAENYCRLAGSYRE